MTKKDIISKLYNYDDLTDIELNYKINLDTWLEHKEDYNERKYLKEAITFNKKSFSHLHEYSFLNKEFNIDNSHLVFEMYELTVRDKRPREEFNMYRKDTDYRISLIDYLQNIRNLLGVYLKKIKSEDPTIKVVNVKQVLITYTEELFVDYILVDDYINNFLKENFYFTSFIDKYNNDISIDNLEKYSFFDISSFYSYLFGKNQVVKLLKNRLYKGKEFKNLRYDSKDDNDLHLKIHMIKQLKIIEFLKDKYDLEDSKLMDLLSDILGCTSRTVRNSYSVEKATPTYTRIAESYIEKLNNLKRNEMDGNIRVELGSFLQNKK